MIRIKGRFSDAMALRKGQTLKVATETGNQVADIWAFNPDDMSEYMSMEHTRSINSLLHVATGCRLVSTRRRTMLRMTVDSAAMHHDTLLCPCSPELYDEFGEVNHRSCTANLHEALAKRGLSCPCTPASFNLFMNVPVATDGSLTRLPPPCKPGDHVCLEADMDLIVVISACPQDITPINGKDCIPSDLLVEILDTPEAKESTA
ncbi:urea carboxylase-associated family protein [Pseudohalocynthiibacter aestuariivivens]|nr:urea carboxylase-associated family protein [Pseudohalocynthiibacter aestuariivivens]QIE45305.1 urea carboxylase-associated family protein [Pseudohalocynthiibacter aestuariivivens]